MKTSAAAPADEPTTFSPVVIVAVAIGLVVVAGAIVAERIAHGGHPA